MTFEEAIEIIEVECGVEDGDGFLTNERGLDPFLAIAIVRNLEDTYALKNWQRVKEFNKYLNNKYILHSK